MKEDKENDEKENGIDKVARCREIVSEANKDAMTLDQAEVLLRHIKDILKTYWEQRGT